MTIDDLRSILQDALRGCPRPARRVLLVHPDYSRNDFSHLVAPLLYEMLLPLGLERFDALNASGTHRRMSQEELQTKLGLAPDRHPRVGTLFNHEYDDPGQLFEVGEVPSRHLDVPMRVTANKLLLAGYDAIICLSGTVPHEALGYSGGTKILFPGVSGPEVIGLLHWAAVLMGIPNLIGVLDNPARDVVDAGAGLIFNRIPCPLLSLSMVYTEDEAHRAMPRGLFHGWGSTGFRDALGQAAALSSTLHIRYLDAPLSLAVQRIPSMYDEVWTAGKGSYKLQRPGVIAPGGEIVLFAPHIDCFHSKPALDAAIREIGYKGREHAIDWSRRFPDFDKNVAAHVINVRGSGHDFRVTLASGIPREQCEAAGLGWRDPATVRREDCQGPGQLWIEDGGQWLYARR